MKIHLQLLNFIYSDKPTNRGRGITSARRLTCASSHHTAVERRVGLLKMKPKLFGLWFGIFVFALQTASRHRRTAKQLCILTYFSVLV